MNLFLYQFNLKILPGGNEITRRSGFFGCVNGSIGRSAITGSDLE